jgi:hypothetical protein
VPAHMKLCSACSQPGGHDTRACARTRCGRTGAAVRPAREPEQGRVRRARAVPARCFGRRASDGAGSPSAPSAVAGGTALLRCARIRPWNAPRWRHAQSSLPPRRLPGGRSMRARCPWACGSAWLTGHPAPFARRRGAACGAFPPTYVPDARATRTASRLQTAGDRRARHLARADAHGVGSGCVLWKMIIGGRADLTRGGDATRETRDARPPRGCPRRRLDRAHRVLPRRGRGRCGRPARGEDRPGSG